jgi:hypothetical protein
MFEADPVSLEGLRFLLIVAAATIATWIIEELVSWW